MTDETEEQEARSLDPGEQKIRSILRRSRLGKVHEVDLLSGVQRRIRDRSRGRFYRDGWSRAVTSTHVMTSILMLIILLLVYFVLLPSLRFG
jgi:hypothetical protein